MFSIVINITRGTI